MKSAFSFCLIFRTCTSIVLSPTITSLPQTFSRISLRKKTLPGLEANKAIWHFDLISIMDNIQYTEYYATEGGHYGWHQDIVSVWLSNRKISITVQLSGPDEYEGGNLDYWQGGEGHTTAPKGKGTVFIFPS